MGFIFFGTQAAVFASRPDTGGRPGQADGQQTGQDKL